jgi:hypothetical protein
MNLCKYLPILLCCWLVGCTSPLGGTDWQARYEAKLDQPIVELNTTVLNSAFQDRNGNLTRVSWARVADGTTTLLGLPAHGNRPEQVVARTVILTQAEWQNLCQTAIGQPVSGWSWSIASDAVGNTFAVHPTLDAQATHFPDPDTPYCAFTYTPSGWELLLVQSQGIVKPGQ